MAKDNEEQHLDTIKSKIRFQIARLQANLASAHAGTTSTWMTRLIEETQMRTLGAVLDELEKDKTVEAFILKRIDATERHIAVTPRSTPNSIASGGRLTAYREILNYIRMH